MTDRSWIVPAYAFWLIAEVGCRGLTFCKRRAGHAVRVTPRWEDD